MAAPTRLFAFLAAGLAGALVGGCGSSGDSNLRVVVVGEPDDPFEKGVRLSPAGQLVRAATSEGLVAFDEQGRVIPAVADRWIVTDDGQSYIFRLRDGTWRDGSELTAKAAAQALRRALQQLRGTPLALDLSGIAEVREMAGRVVEIRLSYPVPHLLQLLAQPELGLVNGGSSAGPMAIEREDSRALLTPIPPQQLGLPEVPEWDERARRIVLSSAHGEEAVSRFNRNEADMVLDGRLADFPHTASVGILRGTIQLDPVEGLFGLQVMTSGGFLAEPGNREALALAIDRPALIARFGVDGWKATTDVIPPSAITDDSAAKEERWTGLALDARRDLAAARVAAWRQARDGAGAAPLLSLWLPPGPGSDIMFERLSEDFAAIGVRLRRAGAKETGDLRLMDVVARYSGPVWYLNRFNCGASKAACSPEADAALAAARRASDPAERAELIARAASNLTDANVFVPFGSPIRWSLVRSDAIGFAPNNWGWHPLMPMALRPK
jgi:peptide/nickel transport system substrate-binding protein/oligopeptide transport system substrate-binding protein